jgi:hypothetical protein
MRRMMEPQGASDRTGKREERRLLILILKDREVRKDLIQDGELYQ